MVHPSTGTYSVPGGPSSSGETPMSSPGGAPGGQPGEEELGGSWRREGGVLGWGRRVQGDGSWHIGLMGLVWPGCAGQTESRRVGRPMWAKPSGGLDLIPGCGLVPSPCREGLQGMSGAASLRSLTPHPHPRWSRLAGCPSPSLPRQGGSHRLPRPGFLPSAGSVHPSPGWMSPRDPRG